MSPAPRTAWRHLALDDAVAMARLRARVLGSFLASGPLLTEVIRLAIPASLDQMPAGAYYPLVGGIFAVGSGLIWRGARVGERTFLAASWFTLILASIAIIPFGSGDTGMVWELLLLPSAIIVAVFATSGRQALAVIVAVAVLMGWGAYDRLAGSPLAVAGLVVEGFVGLVFGLLVRLLRDLAFNALTAARAGEVTDPLTGLTNRRGLERLGTDCWRRRASQHLPISVLMVDIDHFKYVNDTLGHAAGDAVLTRLGDLLQRSSREGDVVVRLGGEEFAVLAALPPGAGAGVGERLRRAVESELAPITVSIGVHEALPTEQDALPGALWQLVEQADRALYVAKRTGRNRVVSGPSVSGTPVSGPTGRGGSS